MFGSVKDTVTCAQMLWSYMSTHLTNDVVNVALGDDLDQAAVDWVANTFCTPTDSDECRKRMLMVKGDFIRFAIGAPHLTEADVKDPPMSLSDEDEHLNQVSREIMALSICSYIE